MFSEGMQMKFPEGTEAPSENVKGVITLCGNVTITC